MLLGEETSLLRDEEVWDGFYLRDVAFFEALHLEIDIELEEIWHQLAGVKYRAVISVPRSVGCKEELPRLRLRGCSGVTRSVVGRHSRFSKPGHDFSSLRV